MEPRVFTQLGPKTFLLLLLSRVWAGFFFLALSFVVNLLSRSVSLLWDISLVGVAVGVLLLFLAIVVSWLDYFRYRIELGDHSVSITRGILSTKEVVVPYRRIQNVLIERGIFDQIIGASHLRFSISHAEGEQPSELSRKPIVLPALRYDLAEHLQTELMRLASTDSISIKKNGNPRDMV